MTKQDRIGAAISMTIGFIYLVKAVSMPSVSIGDPLGPKAFPIILGGLMIVLGSALFLKPEKDVEPISLHRTLKSVLTLAGLLGGYGYSLPLMGYPLGTFFFLFIATRLMGERSMTLSALLSAGLSLSIYGLFTQILGIPLPLGLIEKLTG